MKFKFALASSLLALAMSVGASFSIPRDKNTAEKVDAVYTQSVSQYYKDIDWDETGSTLKTHLYELTNITQAGWSYDGLWNCYDTSDTRSDGYLWDIYADWTTYTKSSTHSSFSGAKEGDYVNREHVIPQSTFNEGAPMKSDAHHVLPCDGFVNGKRSNYPHGNVSSATYTSKDGCKLGTGTNSTTVFEPMDHYKGDIARIYFYFVTCYQNTMGSNSYSVFQSSFPHIKSAYLSVYLQWAKDDPVSQKEIDRNNAIYAGQGNRNPFIDCPYAVGAVFDSTHASDYGTKGEYSGSQSDTPSISISPSSGSVAVGSMITLTATASGGSGNVTWSTTSGSSYVSLSATTGNSISVTGSAAGTATIQASYSGQTATATITVTPVLSSISVQTAPTKITYTAGEYFDPTGLVITRNYQGGSSDNYTYAGHTSEFSFTPSISTALNTSNTSVTITYGGKSTAQAITVNASGGGESGSFSTTYSCSDMSNWSVSNQGTASGYILCPNDSSSYSVALIPGIFTDKTIVSNVEITINCATYGSGDSPTATTFAIYNSSDCSSQVTASQGGTLPASSTYTNVTYTVSQLNAAYFSDDLAIKITKPGRQIRLKSVKVEFDYQTSGSSSTITSISATPNKTFYVGDTITSSDIAVKDNNNNAITDFTFESYQFRYSDASSGGALTNKIFADGVSYDTLTCDLTVQVQRKAYVAPTGSSSFEHTGTEFKTAGIVSAYKENQNVTVDGISFNIDGYIYSNKLSLNDGSSTYAPGKVINTTPYSTGITNVVVNGASPNIQLSTDGENWVNLASATTSVTNYFYLKIYCANSASTNWVNINSITVTTKSNDTPENVANFIMFEDTTNQCTTKFDDAKGYFQSLTKEGRTTFMTSESYVISSARTRLQAWADHLGKTITQSGGDYVISNAQTVSSLTTKEVSRTVWIVLIVSVIGLTSIGAYFFVNRRKLD